MTTTEPARAFWQTSPCPTWCKWAGQHRDDEHPDDRCHDSEMLHTPRVLARVEPGMTGPQDTVVLLTQNDLAAAPAVHVMIQGDASDPGEIGIFRLEEAAHLRDALSRLLDLATAESARYRAS